MSKGKATRQKERTMSKVFTKVDEHIYEDKDGINYDLTALDDLGDGLTMRPRFTAKKDGKEVEIITNNDGEGRWEEFETGTGYDLQQVAGTMQYSLPVAESRICYQLRKMWLNRFGVC
jgi:hypothetical protein